MGSALLKQVPSRRCAKRFGPPGKRRGLALLAAILAHLPSTPSLATEVGATGPTALPSENAEVESPKLRVAHRLWAELACLCGRCARLPLEQCKCSVAKEERQRILDLLAGRDLSTQKMQEAAYQDVKQLYLSRHAHQREGADDDALAPTSNPLDWVVAAAILLILSALMVLVERLRRRSPQTLRTQSARRQRKT